MVKGRCSRSGRSARPCRIFRHSWLLAGRVRQCRSCNITLRGSSARSMIFWLASKTRCGMLLRLMETISISLAFLKSIFVGFSAKRNAFKAFRILTHSSDLHIDAVVGVDLDAAVHSEPFCLTELDDAHICPAVPAEKVQELCRGRTNVGQFDAVKDGLRILNAQRELRISVLPSEPPVHVVGGLAMVSTVTRTDVTQRVVHRWAEDCIGELITPTRPADVVPPVGMSKLQRDMWQRKQRKAQRRVGAL
jgi:hypothetical protein